MMNTDRLTVQLVVVFIGLASLIIIGGLIMLAYTGRDVPEPLSTLGGAAIGALGTLLARTSTVEYRSGRTSGDGSPSNPISKNDTHGTQG